MPFIFYGVSLFIVSRITDVLIDAAIDNYWFVAKIVISLTVTTALARVFINQITLGSYGNLKGILKDCLKFLVFIAFAPLVFTNSVNFVDDLSENITSSAQVTQYKSFDEIKSSIKDGNSNESSGLNTTIQFLRKNSAELYKMCVTWLSVTIAQFLNYLRNLMLIVLFASAPIFIYLGVMLGLRFYSNMVLSMGLSLLIWPILSALLTKFSVSVFQADSANLTASLSQGSSLLIFALAQLLIPLFAAKSALMAANSVIGASKKTGGAIVSMGSSGADQLSKIPLPEKSQQKDAYKYV
ncbi:MAG: type IV secretion system protein [Pseudobdellovibrio sp.]